VRPLWPFALKPGGRHIIIVDTSQASVVFPAMALAVTSIVSSLLPRKRPERGPEGQAHRVRGDVHAHETRLPSDRW
jgi:hypothetical protein